jgi:hypothetical protein
MGRRREGFRIENTEAGVESSSVSADAPVSTVRSRNQLVLSPLAPVFDGSECCDAANLCSIVFSRNQKRIRKSLVCLIRSLRTVTSLSIAAASVLSRRSVSIWFGPAFKICFIISNVLTDLGTLSAERYEPLRLIFSHVPNINWCYFIRTVNNNPMSGEVTNDVGPLGAAESLWRLA